MTKINFTKLDVYKDIAHTQKEVLDIREDIANGIYQSGSGIRFHALALKIYNSNGEVELNDDEYKLLMVYAEQKCPLRIYEALNNIEEENSSTLIK